MASVTKEFHRLMKRVNRLTDRQVTIAEIDWDEGNLECFHIVLQPNDGLYKNGKFKFDVRVPSEYPEIPPVVWCNTDIYHPNIDPTEDWYGNESTNVCLNLLENGVWDKSYGLEGAILGLLFLMHNPNLTDPLSPYFDGVDDWSLFENNVRKYMAGEEFDDISFDKRDFRVVDDVLIEDTPESKNFVDSKSPKDFNDCETEGSGSVSETICASNPETLETCTTNNEIMSDLNILHNDGNNASVNGVRDEKMYLTELTDVLVNVNKSTVNEGSERVNNEFEDEDENSHFEIELVNVDGGYFLKVHNSDFNKTEDQNDDSDKKDQNLTEVSKGDAREITGSFLPNVNYENINCGTEVNFEIENKTTRLNENANAIDNESLTELITCTEESQRKTPREEEDDRDIDDDISMFTTKTKFRCNPWSRIKSAFCKIVHTVVQYKLYRDIGI